MRIAWRRRGDAWTLGMGKNAWRGKEDAWTLEVGKNAWKLEVAWTLDSSLEVGGSVGRAWRQAWLSELGFSQKEAESVRR